MPYTYCRGLEKKQEMTEDPNCEKLLHFDKHYTIIHIADAIDHYR